MTQPTSGAAGGPVAKIRRIVTLLFGMAETRFRLLVVELEEEKTNLLHILLAAGLTLIFTAFTLLSLLLLILLALEPHTRLVALSVTTPILLLCALLFGFRARSRVEKTGLLRLTRKTLAEDRQALEEKDR